MEEKTRKSVYEVGTILAFLMICIFWATMNLLNVQSQTILDRIEQLEAQIDRIERSNKQ